MSELFPLYRRLSDDIYLGKGLPSPLLASLRTLRGMCRNPTGRIYPTDVLWEPGDSPTTELARKLAQTVLSRRRSKLVAMYDAPKSIRPNYPTPPIFDFESRDPRVSIHVDELSELWAAQTFCHVLLRRCKPPLDAGEDEIGYILSPFINGTSATWETAMAAAKVQRAKERAWRLVGQVLGQRGDLAEASRRVGSAASTLYEDLQRRLRESPLPSTETLNPEESLRYIQELDDGGEAILWLEDLRRRQSLGTLPVISGTVARLQANGLGGRCLDGVDVTMREHLTPVVEEMAHVFVRMGAVALRVAGKGVSTVPFAARGLAFISLHCDFGIGDSELNSAEHFRSTFQRIRAWALSAARNNRVFLMIGDGFESARAANAVVANVRKSHPAMQAGYIAVTQSDLTYLTAAEAGGDLAMDVTSLAGTPLKDQGTSQAIGHWIVNNEARWLAQSYRPPLEEARIVVLGGGNIGSAVVRALQERGCRSILVVDIDQERAQKRLAEDGVVDVPVVTRQPGRLPAADYVFSAVGQARALCAADLFSLPEGTVVFNCASRDELDMDYLVHAGRGGVPGVSARPLEGGLLPEHQTLALTSEGSAGKRTVYIRRRGQPAFDGRGEKSVPIMDLAFAGVVHAAAEQLARLRSTGSAPGAHKITMLSDDAQLAILQLAEGAYGLDLSMVRERLLPATGAP